MWGVNDSIKMRYETVFIFSELSGTRDNIPQKAHVDLLPKITKAEEKRLGAKSCITFTPVNPDGMMILVWTDGIKRKYRTLDQIRTDHDRRSKNVYITPGQYFCTFLRECLLLFQQISSMLEGFVLDPR